MILVIGNAVVDVSHRVPALPRPGETVVASAKSKDVGGKGFNQAVTVHRAGSTVRFLAAVGSDVDGERIEEQLALNGLGTDDLIVQDGVSDGSSIYVAETGENSIVSTTDRARSLGIEEAETLLRSLTTADTLLLQGNLSPQTTEACLHHARDKGVRTIVNPAPISFDYLPLWPLIDVAIVNEIEAAALTETPDIEAAAARLSSFGIDLAVITLGKAGALIGSGDDGIRIEAPAVSAVDSTGAGDVFCGVLAAALDQGIAPKAACHWAVAAASLSVTRRGTLSSFPSADELQALRPR
jgi:ribokinase